MSSEMEMELELETTKVGHRYSHSEGLRYEYAPADHKVASIV
jgi:hypothetical protein